MSRQKDIQRIIDEVLETELEFFDNSNGGYDYTCPFCYASICIGGHIKSPTMHTIVHDTDNCIWLIAKNLNTNMNKEKE